MPIRSASRLSAHPPVVPAQRAPRTRTITAPVPTGELRLTRRGRVVATLLFLALLLALFTLFSARSAATGEAGVDLPARTVVVSEGDTLWGIASEVAAPGQTRELVHEMQELNSLPGPALVEGQELVVPLQ
jgi:hypothetical protein